MFVTFLFCQTTNLSKLFLAIKSTALTPKALAKILSKATGAAPPCICPSEVTLHSISNFS